MKAYEDASARPAKISPWYVVPADDKENARLIVSQIVLDTFEGLKMSYPKTGAKRRKELLSIRGSSRSELRARRCQKAAIKEERCIPKC